MQLAQNGIGIGAVTAAQMVDLATAIIPHVSGAQTPANKLKLEKIAGAYVESTAHADRFLTDMTLERAMINTPVGPQSGMKQEVIWQRWDKEK
jgi:hypothetical protein